MMSLTVALRKYFECRNQYHAHTGPGTRWILIGLLLYPASNFTLPIIENT